MKKNVLVILIAILAIAGYLIYSHFSTNTLKLAQTIEEPCLTIDLPKAFEEGTEDNTYINEDKMMFVEFKYYPNEFKLDAETMLKVAIYNEFQDGDVLSTQEVEINGEDAWQAEYRTLTTGYDGIHYYYSGVMTAFMLENEVVFVDAYQAMTESEGIDKIIAQSDMQLLKDITATVKLTDTTYSEYPAEAMSVAMDKLTLHLTDSWAVPEEDDTGWYDFGYYTFYYLGGAPMAVEAYEYTDDYAYTEDDLQNAGSDYTFVGNQPIGDENGYVYSYNGTTGSDRTPYYYGVLVVSEHYWVDLFYFMYDDDHEISQDTIEAMADILARIE